MMMTQISGDIKSGRYLRTHFFETTEKANSFTEATGGILAHHDSLASVLMRDHKQTCNINIVLLFVFIRNQSMGDGHTLVNRVIRDANAYCSLHLSDL